MATAIGIKTQGTISDWENDKRDPEPDNLLRLAEFFRVPAESLGYPMPRGTTSDEPPAWAVALDAKVTALLRYHATGDKAGLKEHL